MTWKQCFLSFRDFSVINWVMLKPLRHSPVDPVKARDITSSNASYGPVYRGANQLGVSVISSNKTALIKSKFIDHVDRF
jgi:hypothetical protein